MPIKTTIIDLGYKDYIKDIKQLKNKPNSEIGIFNKKKRANSNLDNVVLMAIHEFGIGVVQRSPIRGATDDNKRAMDKLIDTRYKKNIKLMDILAEIGEKMQVLITKRFGNTNYLVSNAPATIRKKGFNKPLIDTGKLVKDIEHKENKISK